MRALIFSEGNGYGHAARDRLISEHFDIPLMTFGKGAEYCKLNNMDFTEIPSPYKIQSGPEKVKIAANISEIMELLRPEAIHDIRTRFAGVDFVIVDGSSLGLAIAMLMGKKSVFITNDTSALVGINGTLQKRVASSLFRRLLGFPKSVIVPDFPPPLTISSLSLHTEIPLTFCGPLIYQMPQKKHNKKYLVVGKLENELSGILGSNAIFGSGTEDIKAYYRDCEVVICHGGHTTIMEALSYGKSVLCIVDKVYSERVNNATLLEQKDLGIMLDRSTLTRDSVLSALDYAETLNTKRLNLYAKTHSSLKPLKTMDEILKKLVDSPSIKFKN